MRSNPYRLAPSQAATADQDHSYTQEQIAYDHGKMDFFPAIVGQGVAPDGSPAPQRRKSLNLAYFDGNTVTALWNYAQRFAMSDRFFQTTFGPSVLGALNLVSGQTNGVTRVKNGASPNVLDRRRRADRSRCIGDVDPIGDICSSSKRIQVTMGGRNIGDLLNAANVSWGWFEEGFDVKAVNADGTTGLRARSHTSAVTGLAVEGLHRASRAVSVLPVDGQSEARAARRRWRRSAGRATRRIISTISTDFFAALDAGHFPAVAFLKPAAYQNGHAGYSDPIDEQAFLVRVLNDLQQPPGVEEHRRVADVGRLRRLVRPPDGADRQFVGRPGRCARRRRRVRRRHGDSAGHLAGDASRAGRCGYGPRLPLLVISPWARTQLRRFDVTDMTSILRFIEDVFLDGRRIGGGSFDAIAGPAQCRCSTSRERRTSRRCCSMSGREQVQTIGRGASLTRYALVLSISSAPPGSM